MFFIYRIHKREHSHITISNMTWTLDVNWENDCVLHFSFLTRLTLVASVRFKEFLRKVCFADSAYPMDLNDLGRQ